MIVLMSSLTSFQKFHSIESIISSKLILCSSTNSTKNFISKYQAPNKFLVISLNTISFIINNLKNKVIIHKKITIKKTRWRLVLPCFYYFIFRISQFILIVKQCLLTLYSMKTIAFTFNIKYLL